ncbi:MAG: hypothetical protein KH135_02800 [Firmicutes bacterium]|nr:hypothetical protein [Bacillota bacterium]
MGNIFKDNHKKLQVHDSDNESSKIMDFEEMNLWLDGLKGTKIKEVEPIGFTTFHYPIRHFVYGHGKNHVILTAGTHAAELITNHFLIHFMNTILNQNDLIDETDYTLHLIPILNPEGTIIVTSAIRTVIPRKTTPFWEELFCMQYYMNSKLEDQYVIDKNDHDNKLQMWMFRYADVNCISKIHDALKKNVEQIIKEQHLPEGVLSQWSSNGMGIDLNANVKYTRYYKETIEKIKVPHILRLNQISNTFPGPIGCPFQNQEFAYEKENEALLHFYHKLINEEQVIGSLIYHSCGNYVYYLDKEEMENPYRKEYGEKEFQYNHEVAKVDAKVTGYRLLKDKKYTTMDALLKTMLPGTLLIELGNIRSNPLSQFIDTIDNVYTNIMEKNTEAIPIVLEEMRKQYGKNYQKENV